MSSHISKEHALELINNYREGLPPGSLKSVWLNREIIDFIVANAAAADINGMRVYLAKYDITTASAAIKLAPDAVTEPAETVVVVPTVPGASGGEEDMENGYFNYGRPCPYHCSGDAGN